MTENGTVGWRGTAQHLLDWRVLRIGVLGFAAGLPLLLVFGTLSFWLSEAGVDRATIGFISWVALAYAVKVFWSPLVDRLPIPLLSRALGRRRAWMLLAQAGIIAGLVGVALTDPAVNLERLVVFAVLVAVASATQDIAIDAYRIEMAERAMQGILAGFYTTGYRLGMILGGAGALGIAAWFDPDESAYHYLPWMYAYLGMAVAMLIGPLTVLLSPEPAVDPLGGDPAMRKGNMLGRLGHWLLMAVAQPFLDFFRRYGWLALLVLALIASYRLSDIVLGVIANVFYENMGYTKAEVALVSKGFGVVVTIVGTLFGGILVYRVGIMRMLFVGAVLVALTNLLFAWLATLGHDFWMLVVVVGMDNLSAGIAVAAFIAYLSSLTNISYSATQYALFSSFMALVPKLVGGFSGVMVNSMGYPAFFTVAATMGIPAMVLVALAARYTTLDGRRQGGG